MLNRVQGIIVGFNKIGEGGKGFVHVLHDGQVTVYMAHEVEVISTNDSR